MLPLVNLVLASLYILRHYVSIALYHAVKSDCCSGLLKICQVVYF